MYKRYLNYKANKEKVLKLQKQQKEKLAKILEEEEVIKFKKMKQEIINEAVNYTEGFTLKLEKWLEMLQSSPQYQEKRNLHTKKLQPLSCSSTLNTPDYQ